MPDPFVDAARGIFATTADALLEGVAGRSAEQLNWTPAWGETNSIAVISTHAFGSARSWLACAMGAPMPARDRDGEFRTVAASADDLVASLTAWRTDCEAYLAGDPALPWDEERSTHQPGETRTGAWAMVHALEHAREHLGQLWLTDELYRSLHP